MVAIGIQGFVYTSTDLAVWEPLKASPKARISGGTFIQMAHRLGRQRLSLARMVVPQKPFLEAFKRGIPVLTSVSSLRPSWGNSART